MYSSSYIVYWTLKIIVLLLMMLAGFCIANNKFRYIKITTTIAVASFSLFEGLRWMRGYDYYHYYLDVTTNLKAFGCTPQPEIFYKWWCSFFYSLGLEYYVAFIIYAFLFIFSYFFILKRFKKCAFWALPIIFLIQTPSLENHIRQYIAISFLLLSFYFHQNLNRKGMVLCAISGVFFHVTALFFIVIWIVFERIDFLWKEKYLFPLILVYILMLLLWDTSMLSHFSSLLGKYSYNQEFAIFRYMDNVDRWFSDEGSLSGGVYNLSMYYKFFNVSSSLFIIYFGHKLALFHKETRTIFLFTYISLILQIIAGDVELFLRFYMWTAVFVPIVMSYIICEKKGRLYDFILKSFYAIYIYGYYIFFQMSHTYAVSFVWDK